MQNILGSQLAENLPEPTGAVLRYARLVANNQKIDENLVEIIRSSLGDIGLIDLTVMVGYYQLIGTFCNTLHVPIEDGMKRTPFNK